MQHVDMLRAEWLLWVYTHLDLPVTALIQLRLHINLAIHKFV